MPIELTCPGCGKQLRLADEHAGKAGRCPACQATFQIPAAGPAQIPGSPFGASTPAPQPPTSAASPFAGSSQPPPAGNLFGEQNAGAQTNPFASSGSPPNPFASTSNTQSPYGGVNPYGQPAPNMYASGPPGEGQATASMILGIVSIVFGFLSPCCCLGLFVGVPCGVIGLILAFQVPAERRNVGMILNIIGIALSVLITAGWWIFNIAIAAANHG
jgi:hypothetical protein